MDLKFGAMFLLALLPTVSYGSPGPNLFTEAMLGMLSYCNLREYQCTDRTCIPRVKLCDGVRDCNDASDEIDCDSLLCNTPNLYRCADGKCILSALRCNNQTDCAGGDDELNCTTSIPKNSCPNSKPFQCGSGICIYDSWVCDGVADCMDRSDEIRGCNLKNRCSIDEFMCKNHRCVPKVYRCDSVNDCADGSDEMDCPHLVTGATNCTNTTNNAKFRCKDGRECIDLYKICDKKTDCTDNSDEDPAMCAAPKVVNHCGKNCSYQCIRGAQGDFCICPAGFILRNNGSCEDVNECNEFGICDQICNNTAGSYTCSCRSNYELLPDNHTCQIKDGEGVLFYSTVDKIKGHFLRSDFNFTLIEGLRHTTGISSAGLYLYWTVVERGYQSIVRSKDSHESQETIVTNGLRTPEDLVVDWITLNIYFTDADYRRIVVCTNDGYNCVVLHSENIDKPRAIALSPRHGYMFWSDWGAKPVIARSNMDGTQAKDLVVDELHWPNGVTVDAPSERLYWVDAKYERIETITFGGNDRRIVLSQFNIHPFAITVFENRIYWSDFAGKEIISCNKFTGHDRKIIAHEPLNRIYGLHAYHHLLMERNDVTNPCQQRGCTDICLLTRSAKGELGSTCVCDESRALVGRSCVNRRSFRALIAALGNELFVVDYKTLGRGRIEKVATDVIGIVDVAHHAGNKSALIFDTFTRRVKSVDLSTRKITDAGALTTTRGRSLQYDELGDNVYYCNGETLAVEVTNLRTSSKTILINGTPIKAPRSLAVVPEKGYMFVAYRLDSYRHRIERVSMCGSLSAAHNFAKIRVYASNVILHYSRELERLFWVSTSNGIIESATLDGNDRLVIYHGRPVHSITTIDNWIFVSEPNSPVIRSRRFDANEYAKFSVTNSSSSLTNPNAGIVLAAAIGSNLGASPCAAANCSDLCLLSHESPTGFRCACAVGYALSTDGATCARRRLCSLNEFRCYTGECIAKYLLCNGREDCLRGEDEELDNCDVGRCPVSQFLCADRRKCVDRKRKCDGRNDCDDASDELFCNATCTADQYSCEFGECIERQFRCDGKVDCQHGYDETHCDNRTCNADDEFQCKSGQCVPKEWECDRESDCGDGSDEGAQCADEKRCFDHEFRCSNGNCVGISLTCNGQNDCGDGSDELDCDSNRTPKICNKNFDFYCRWLNRCMPNAALCNGTVECPDGYDEQNCSPNPCNSNAEFYCNQTKKCIPLEWLCDGHNDCGDNIDEKSSVCLSFKPVKATECAGFRCSNGQCVSTSRVCDNIYDCSDKSDEGVGCNRTCGSYGCAQQCRRTPGGPRCSCNNGFILGSDNKTCVDVNECDSNICSQICKNTNGSFVCGCYSPGYLLKSNHVTCKARGDSLLFITASESELDIFSTNMKHKIGFNVGMNLFRRIRAMDTDGTKNQIFVLMENDELFRMNISQRRPLESLRLSQATTFTHDWITDNVYYVENYASIVVTNFKSTKKATVYRTRNNENIWALSVDPVAGHLFWSEGSIEYGQRISASIMRADCDGANAKPILSKLSYGVQQLVIDSWARRIYWINGVNRNCVYRVNYDGLHVEEVLHTRSNIEKFTFFENTIYWVSKDSTEYPIRKCKIYGIPPLKCSAMPAKFGYLDHLAILQKNRQRSVEYDPCIGMSCQHFCLQLPHGAACAFENGENSELCATSSCVKTDGGFGSFFAYFIILCVICMVIVVLYNRFKNQKSQILHRFHFHNPTYDTPEKNNEVVGTEKEITALKPGEHIYENPLCEEPKITSKNELSIENGGTLFKDATYEVEVEYDPNTRRVSNESLIRYE